MHDAPSPKILKLHADDNVGVVVNDLALGAETLVGDATLKVNQSLAQGHKVALVPIAQSQPVLKYGQTIGFATADVAPGDWVHTHNLAAGDFARDYAYSTQVPPAPDPITDRTFSGYRRADGRAGTRNYIAVISSVNCSASVSRYVAQRFDESLKRDFPHVDGVVALTHKGGCGMQYDGDDHLQLDRVLAGFARHPNVGGYLLIGLGCETGTLAHLIDGHDLVQIGDTKRPPAINIQDVGGVSKTVDAAVARVQQMLPRVNDVRRESIPAAELVLATECGGSDGNSGITANPALGVASDLLVAAGGTTILAETPEIYGAEHLLTRRARTPEVGQRLVERIRWWENYTAASGARIDNNPSPGNKAGGLTTIYEKSLGAVAKAGHTALNAVYCYAEPVRQRGFVIMDSPGYDPASVTGMVAGGANVICFTTGRGSCFGCKPVPSIKIATNTAMYERMRDDMDVNAGVVLTGTPVETVGREIFETILRVASGEQTKSEAHGIGEEEFLPWSIGPTL